jgi:galactokinase
MEMACYTAAAPLAGNKLRVFSRNMNEAVEWPIDDLPNVERRGHWSDYPAGIARQLLALGIEIRPADIAIYSDVPVGAGLSSSASIEVSVALALLRGRSIDPLELAKLAQRAEREFVGVPCGIMDQYVSVFGEAGKAICIDCRSITHESVPLPPEAAIIAVNSMVKHDLGSSAYAVRVRECNEAVEAIRVAYPEVASLRDVTSETLDRLRGSMPDEIFRRARHVTTENERVLAFTAAAAKGDLLAMGRLFLASHRSMQQDYEITCEEIDYLVDTASAFSGVFGARMTGGGFGGCTVNLVALDRADLFKQHITAAYERQYQITPQIYDCIPGPGASEIE